MELQSSRCWLLLPRPLATKAVLRCDHWPVRKGPADPPLPKPILGQIGNKGSMFTSTPHRYETCDFPSAGSPSVILLRYFFFLWRQSAAHFLYHGRHLDHTQPPLKRSFDRRWRLRPSVLRTFYPPLGSARRPSPPCRASSGRSIRSSEARDSPHA